MFSASVGAAISLYLGYASYQFVASERVAGGVLAYGMPTWVVELVLPFGFAVIALRLLFVMQESVATRFKAAALCAALTVVAAFVVPGHVFAVALVLLGLATLIGTPVFVTLGGSALILFWGADQPIASIPIAHYGLVTNPTLPSIPLFTIAGYIL